MSNVPKLRFSDFQDNWMPHRIMDIGKVSMCKRVFKEQTTSAGDIPFFKIGTFGKLPDAFISSALYEEYRAKYSFPKVGDILISASGTIGRTVVFDGAPAYFQDSNIVWIDNDENLVLNKFLLYCYENTHWTTEDTTIARLYNDNLKKIPIILPAIKEQQKIADFLTSVDNKIEQLSKKQELLGEYKKGLMQKIFRGELRFKADDGSEFPDWEEKKLGDVAKITTGSSNREDSGLDGQYTFFDRSEDIRTSERYLFDGKAVIVAGEGSSFPPKYFEGKFDLHQRTYAIMDFIEADTKFIFYLIDKHKNYLLRYAVGSTVKSLRLPIFQKMPVRLPLLEEQTKISNFLSSIDNKIEQVGEQLDKSKEFKKALLQQMFV